DHERLLAMVTATIEHPPRFGGWFVGAVLSWLPEKFLDRVARTAVGARIARPNQVADDVIETVSLQHPTALTPFLRELWDADPITKSYYRTWPWRAADDSEIARLTRIVESSSDDRQRAARCLLQTRRPDLLS